MKKEFSFIDLFAGIGGFRIAIQRFGGNCIGFSEIDSDAIYYYCMNFNESSLNNLGDITKINSLPEHDLLVGGVPCQSWSIAGRNLGFDDDRGQLWNDTIFLLNKFRPKAFIFENVKGLVDPRNKNALAYILERIRLAGYHANFFILNAYDYGIPQNRVRVYIIGFREKQFLDSFSISKPLTKKTTLNEVIENCNEKSNESKGLINYETDLFGNILKSQKSMSISNNNGINDYFLFNDIRNGKTTIHSWDLINTTDRQKQICLLLLKNRRKSRYGNLDGNPLALSHFQDLDQSIKQEEIDEIVNLGIFKPEQYSFFINDLKQELSEDENFILSLGEKNFIIPDKIFMNKEVKKKKIRASKVITSLISKNILECNEVRYDFKYSKISTGLFGVNRIFLPCSNLFSTLVASDTNDFITSINVQAKSQFDFKYEFIKQIYEPRKYRKISKKEACRLQGFPDDMLLPDKRQKWMKLIGNSVAPPVIEMICKSICKTGVFG